MPDGLGGSWCTWIAKDAKIRKFTFGKASYGKAKGVTAKSFAEENRYLTQESIRPSQQTPAVELGLSWKHLRKTLLSKGVDPLAIHRRPTRFLRSCISRNTANLN